MAFIDYGVIVFKNGKIINKSTYFNDMKEMVGWETDDEVPIYQSFVNTGYKFKLKDNCFAYIGDEDCTVGFYKDIMYIYYISNSNPILQAVYLCSTNYTWSKWSNYFFVNGKLVNITVKKRNGYLICKMNYNGDKYKVYFGYGVDLNCYKKWHLVNYYRTPWFLVGDFFGDIEYRIKKR